jgi:hypothetical protein
MNPITHFFMGWTVANAAPALVKRDRLLVTLAGVAPDLDGLGIVAEWLTRGSTNPWNWWTDYHHVMGHNLGFILLASAIIAVLSRSNFTTILLVWVSFHLHLLADLVGARGPEGDQWPIPYLLPFSGRIQLAWSGQWALNAWPNFVITAALMAAALAWARQRGFSPLEMISNKADAALVQALRTRFPVSVGSRNSVGRGND